MNMHALYRSEELAQAQAREKRVRRAMLAVAAVGFVACVVLCCFATRKNQSLFLPLIVGTSILSGWIVIFLSHSVHEKARAEARHTELMLTGPRERYSGRFEKLEGVYRVKKGVSIRKVRQREEYHEVLLTVYDAKAEQLPEAFSGTVEAVYDCIVAYAEEGEA